MGIIVLEVCNNYRVNDYGYVIIAWLIDYFIIIIIFLPCKHPYLKAPPRFKCV